MTKYLALLRGINVGGKNSIKMQDLRRAFEDLSFSDVKTFIASGNVLFNTDISDRLILTKQIESALVSKFKVSTKVLILEISDIKKIISLLPASWVSNKDMKCDVMFLWKEVDSKNILKDLPSDPKIEDIKYVPGAVIWRIDRDKVSKSKMLKIVGTKLHQQMTVRNPNTVRKIYSLMLD